MLIFKFSSNISIAPVQNPCQRCVTNIPCSALRASSVQKLKPQGLCQGLLSGSPSPVEFGRAGIPLTHDVWPFFPCHHAPERWGSKGRKDGEERGAQAHSKEVRREPVAFPLAALPCTTVPWVKLKSSRCDLIRDLLRFGSRYLKTNPKKKSKNWRSLCNSTGFTLTLRSWPSFGDGLAPASLGVFLQHWVKQHSQNQHRGSLS